MNRYAFTDRRRKNLCQEKIKRNNACLEAVSFDLTVLRQQPRFLCKNINSNKSGLLCYHLGFHLDRCDHEKSISDREAEINRCAGKGIPVLY